MSLTPEQSQKVTDLRMRMLKNVEEGKPSHEGITEDEIREGLAFVSQARIIPAKAAAKKRAAANPKVAAPLSNPKFSKFSALLEGK